MALGVPPPESLALNVASVNALRMTALRLSFRSAVASAILTSCTVSPSAWAISACVMAYASRLCTLRAAGAGARSSLMRLTRSESEPNVGSIIIGVAKAPANRLPYCRFPKREERRSCRAKAKVAEAIPRTANPRRFQFYSSWPLSSNRLPAMCSTTSLIGSLASPEWMRCSPYFFGLSCAARFIKV